MHCYKETKGYYEKTKGNGNCSITVRKYTSEMILNKGQLSKYQKEKYSSKWEHYVQRSWYGKKCNLFAELKMANMMSKLGQCDGLN